MRHIAFIFIFLFAGCASVQSPGGYISRVDHSYNRKIYAGFEKVVSSLNFVLKKQGWVVVEESEPSIYERDDRYDNNGYQNLLIIADTKKHFIHVNSARLNVFIHSINNTCDVEIRHEGHVSVQGILDAIQEEVAR